VAKQAKKIPKSKKKKKASTPKYNFGGLKALKLDEALLVYGASPTGDQSEPLPYERLGRLIAAIPT
jgi:hypothetical protein